MESFAQVEVFWLVFLQICGGICAIGATVAVIVKLYQWLRKPSTDNAASIDQMMDYLASDKRRLEALERKQVSQDEEQQLILTALMQLMSHEIDGNHTEQLTAARDEIQAFLITSRVEHH